MRRTSSAPGAASIDQHQRLFLMEGAHRPEIAPFQPACSMSQLAAKFVAPVGLG